jgi:hypothetical protein
VIRVRPRRGTSLRALLALALLLLAGASGCGGDQNKADNAYVDAVNQAQSDFAATFDKLAAKISATSTPQQDVRTLQGLRGAVSGAVKRLHAIKPPDRVKTLHAQLVTALGDYAGALARAQEAFATSDPQQVIAAETRLTSAVTQLGVRINHTIDAINSRLRG